MANVVIITGRLTKDPELRQTPSGVSAVSIRIACDRYIGKGKEKKADFFNVEAWRSTAEFIANHFQKGKLIEIVGSLQTSPWTDKNSSKHEGVRILAERVNFAPTEAAPAEGGTARTAPQPQAASTPPQAAPAAPSGEDLSAAFANFGGFASSFSSGFEEIQENDDLPF